MMLPAVRQIFNIAVDSRGHRQLYRLYIKQSMKPDFAARCLAGVIA